MDMPPKPPNMTHEAAAITKAEDVLTPITTPSIKAYEQQGSARVKGRLADKCAAIIAATALGLSIFLSGLFFAGFVANDYHIFAITSALGLSLFLGAFAIVPMAIIMMLARKSYRNGGNTVIYLWSLFLSLPWLGLSILCLIFTPLPVWMSAFTVLFAAVLTIWGMISLGLEVRDWRKLK